MLNKAVDECPEGFGLAWKYELKIYTQGPRTLKTKIQKDNNQTYLLFAVRTGIVNRTTNRTN